MCMVSKEGRSGKIKRKRNRTVGGDDGEPIQTQSHVCSANAAREYG
jgi:hypothetical protein